MATATKKQPKITPEIRNLIDIASEVKATMKARAFGESFYVGAIIDLIDRNRILTEAITKLTDHVSLLDDAFTGLCATMLESPDQIKPGAVSDKVKIELLEHENKRLNRLLDNELAIDDSFMEDDDTDDDD